jgi:hypothetical protein
MNDDVDEAVVGIHFSRWETDGMDEDLIPAFNQQLNGARNRTLESSMIRCN